MVVLSLEEVLCLSQRGSTVQNMLIMVDGGGEKRDFSQGKKIFLRHVSGWWKCLVSNKRKKLILS